VVGFLMGLEIDLGERIMWVNYGLLVYCVWGSWWRTKQGRLTHYGCICVFHILHRGNLGWGYVDLGRIERTRLVLFVGAPKKTDSLRSPQMCLIEHVRKINELHEKKHESSMNITYIKF
jgi:hypothetical protein